MYFFKNNSLFVIIYSYHLGWQEFGYSIAGSEGRTFIYVTSQVCNALAYLFIYFVYLFFVTWFPME